jgi:hypothetical protein
MAELTDNGSRGYINKIGKFRIKKPQLDTYLGKCQRGLQKLKNREDRVG